MEQKKPKKKWNIGSYFTREKYGSLSFGKEKLIEEKTTDGFVEEGGDFEECIEQLVHFKGK